MTNHIEDSVTIAKPTFFGRLRGYFLTGIVITAPIAITIYLTWSFLLFVDNTVSKIIPPQYNPEAYLPVSLPGLGLIIAIVFFIIIGVLAKNFFGRLMIRVSEYIVHRVPVVSSLYGTVKQIFETVMASQSDAFKDAVMFEYPRKGMWVVGFVTGTTQGEIQERTGKELVNVFLPTTPNPTSGFLLFIPREELIDLDMSVEEALKMIVSGGIITPPVKS